MIKFINILSQLVPPFLLTLIKRLAHLFYGWKGNYKNWEEVKNISIGYDDSVIIKKVLLSTNTVIQGNAEYERDGLLFYEESINWNLLASIFLASNRDLNIIDFGGAFGSTYFQNRKILNALTKVSWNIVEQKSFVEASNKIIKQNNLNFYYSIDDAYEANNSNVILFSSVLQYLENYHSILMNAFEKKFEYIIIDRTPFSQSDTERITLQVIPTWIYKSSYPCRIFSKSNLLEFFSNNCYQSIYEFDSLDKGYKDIIFKGYLFKRVD